jgi:hypothetical protein
MSGSIHAYAIHRENHDAFSSGTPPSARVVGVDANETRKGEENSANARKLNWIAHGVCPGTRGHVLENEHKERQRDDQVALSAHKHLPSWAAA